MLFLPDASPKSLRYWGSKLLPQYCWTNGRDGDLLMVAALPRSIRHNHHLTLLLSRHHFQKINRHPLPQLLAHTINILLNANIIDVVHAVKILAALTMLITSKICTR